MSLIVGEEPLMSACSVKSTLHLKIDQALISLRLDESL